MGKIKEENIQEELLGRFAHGGGEMNVDLHRHQATVSAIVIGGFSSVTLKNLSMKHLAK